MAIIIDITISVVLQLSFGALLVSFLWKEHEMFFSWFPFSLDSTYELQPTYNPTLKHTQASNSHYSLTLDQVGHKRQKNRENRSWISRKIQPRKVQRLWRSTQTPPFCSCRILQLIVVYKMEVSWNGGTSNWIIQDNVKLGFIQPGSIHLVD